MVVDSKELEKHTYDTNIHIQNRNNIKYLIMSKEIKLALIIGAGFVVGGIMQSFIQPMLMKKAVKEVAEEGGE